MFKLSITEMAPTCCQHFYNRHGQGEHLICLVHELTVLFLYVLSLHQWNCTSYYHDASTTSSNI